MAFGLLSKSLLSRMSVSISASPELDIGMSGGGGEIVADSPESGFSHLMNKELYPVREKVVDENCPCDVEPFRPLSGESIEFMGPLQDDYVIVISNYRLFATQEDGFYSVPLGLIEAMEVSGTKDKLLVSCRDARTFKLFFNSQCKCKLWQERLVECLRRLSKEPKSAFAFVHRAYNKDKKMAKQDLLRLGLEEAGCVVEWEEPEAEEEEVDDGGTNRLLSMNADSERWRDKVVTTEYERMGMGPSDRTGMKYRPWRITQCNDKYKLCGTYPKLLVVPNSITDEELEAAAKFRMSGRIPAVVWRHQTNGCVIARSSQPLVGVLGWRSPEDEKLLFAISKSCTSVTKKTKKDINNIHLKTVTNFSDVQTSSSAPQLLREREGVLMSNGNGVANGFLNESAGLYSDSDDEKEITHGSVVPKLKVFDLRSYTAALGNRAKGGGCECTDYYPNCEVQYKCLPNIHAVRKSFLQLRAVLLSDEQINFLSSLESTQWLQYLCQLLSVACEVVGVVNDIPQPILIHCSDGWDRTTQVVALAELMLDPYYRTIKGFKVLIEREWLGFGHKFGERCGLTTDDANQQSPVFLQWLDCVHQLTRQYPCDFQFNENFLLKLGRHVYSCLYGTFLYNSMKERELARVNEDTTSVWALLHENNPDITNYLYCAGDIENKVLRPVPHIRSMLLWKEMYATPLLIPYKTSSSPITETTSPHPSTPKSVSLSSTPSPSHHAPLTQMTCLGGDSNGTNIEVDIVTKEEKSQAVVKDDTRDLEGSGLAAAEVKGQENVALPQVKGQDDVPVCEVNGQNGVIPSEMNVSTSLNSQEKAPDEVARSEVSDGHLLTAEHYNGLILSGSCGEREFANMLTQQPSSLVSVIEMKDLTHTEDIRLHDDEGRPRTVPPPVALPIVNGKSKALTSTLATTFTYRSNSEPILSDRTDTNRFDSGNNDGDDNKKCRNGILYVESVIASKPTVETETGFTGKTEDVNTVTTSSIENDNTDNRFALGIDGLPCSLDPLQKRVRELELKHRREVEELRSSLKEAQFQVTEAVRLKQEERKRSHLEENGLTEEGGRLCTDGSQPSLHSDDIPSPSSLHSWDCVDQDVEHGVRWIPDHAATHCQLCGAAFWTARRKHHCRSCGGVFCATCSNYYCPVPHEQLFVDVRVCEKCYYRLDGHLKNGRTQNVSTTPT